MASRRQPRNLPSRESGELQVYTSRAPLQQRYFPDRQKRVKRKSSERAISPNRQQTITQMVDFLPPPSSQDANEEVPSRRRKKKQRKITKPASLRQQTVTQIVDFIPTRSFVGDTDSEEEDWERPQPERKRRKTEMAISSDEARQQTLTQMHSGIVTMVPDSDEDSEEYSDDNEGNNIEHGADSDAESEIQHYSRVSEEEEHDYEEGYQYIKRSDSDYEDNMLGFNGTVDSASTLEIKVKQEPSESNMIPSIDEIPTKSSRSMNRNTQHNQNSAGSPTNDMNIKTEFKIPLTAPRTPPRKFRSVIPSSQSPPSGPLSTQKTGGRFTRSPLRERSSNQRVVLDSPTTNRSIKISPSDIEQRSGAAILPLDVLPPRSSPSSRTPLARTNTIADSDDEDYETEDEAPTSDLHVPSRTNDMSSPRGPVIKPDPSQLEPTHKIKQEELDEAEIQQPFTSELDLDGTIIPSQFSPYLDRTIQTTENQDPINSDEVQTPRPTHSRRCAPIPTQGAVAYNPPPLPISSSHPSQVSTVASTQQASSRAIQPLEPPFPREYPSVVVPSSPLPLPPLSSSPILSTGDGKAGMLPESLYDYSLPPPPPWTQFSDQD